MITATIPTKKKLIDLKDDTFKAKTKNAALLTPRESSNAAFLFCE